MPAEQNLSQAQFPRRVDWGEHARATKAGAGVPAGDPEDIPLGRIVMDPDSPAFPDIAEEYSTLDTPFPPISAVARGEDFHVTDGRHRAYAAHLRGDASIRGRVSRP